jgi:Kef-type K+ transport system membrane component KefB
MSASQLSILFFVQMAIILGVCRLVCFVTRRLGQAQVVGEMIAGVLLGPSLFGILLPNLQHLVFPSGASMNILYTVSQVGLVLYMFLVGTEFDTNLIRHRLRSAASVSLAGILTPMTLGILLAALFIHQPGLFSAQVPLPQAMLFLGAAISITAFPMLARIIVEAGLSGTSLGTLALAAGSTDDAISWCLLAVVLAIFKQNIWIALFAVVGGVLYAVLTLTALRVLLAHTLGRMAENLGGLTDPMFVVVLFLLMICAWITDTLGIYSIFGGFILGVAMPRGVVTRQLKTTMEPLVTKFLLPTFFVYSGLNTSVGLVNSWLLWGIAALIFIAAVGGKGIACWLAALANKESNREALAIGSLMNARGLMELILLNIALQQGIITQTLFTMLILMAIATTLMASPLFELVYGRFREKKEGSEKPAVIMQDANIAKAEV